MKFDYTKIPNEKLIKIISEGNYFYRQLFEKSFESLIRQKDIDFILFSDYLTQEDFNNIFLLIMKYFPWYKKHLLSVGTEFCDLTIYDMIINHPLITDSLKYKSNLINILD